MNYIGCYSTANREQVSHLSALYYWRHPYNTDGWNRTSDRSHKPHDALPLSYISILNKTPEMDLILHLRCMKGYLVINSLYVISSPVSQFSILRFSSRVSNRLANNTMALEISSLVLHVVRIFCLQSLTTNILIPPFPITKMVQAVGLEPTTP